MARRRKSDVWADWMPPGPKEETTGPTDASPSPTFADAAEPAPRVHLEPMFPVGGTPFTPGSPCPHWCKRCSGSGVVGVDETGSPVECPDCLDVDTGKGTGESSPGAPFVCMCCDRSGLDGSRALPLDVEPLPPGPPMGDEVLPDARAMRREKARLQAYVAKGLKLLEGKRGKP